MSGGRAPAQAPPWLEAFQGRFSAMLRASLDRRSGKLRAVTDRYDPVLVDEVSPSASHDAPERLAVYNRQYWFRLFGVIQNEHRLTCALTGAWAFNDLAARFLAAQPPRGHDLARAADGFADWVRDDVRQPLRLGPGIPPLPPRAVSEAVRIDAAYRTLFWADDRAGLDEAALAALDPEALATSCLVPSERCALVAESWRLVELRRGLPSAPVEKPRRLPKAHARGPRHLVLHRVGAETRALPLDPVQARLLALLSERPVGEALARLEKDCPPGAAATLPADVQRWLAASVRLGFWRGIERC